MSAQCIAWQEQYDAINAAIIELHTGERITANRNREKEVSSQMGNIVAMERERARLASLLSTHCAIEVNGPPIRRFAQPSMGDGRC
jgi:hypothetical protein